MGILRLTNSCEIVARVLPREKLRLWLFDLEPLPRWTTGGNPGHLFNQHVLLRSNNDVPHPGNIVLHQMLLGVGDCIATH